MTAHKLRNPGVRSDIIINKTARIGARVTDANEEKYEILAIMLYYVKKFAERLHFCR